MDTSLTISGFWWLCSCMTGGGGMTVDESGRRRQRPARSGFVTEGLELRACDGQCGDGEGGLSIAVYGENLSRPEWCIILSELLVLTLVPFSLSLSLSLSLFSLSLSLSAPLFFPSTVFPKIWSISLSGFGLIQSTGPAV